MDLHVVQPGDTIYRLAQQYGVSMDRLLQDNQLPDPSHLVVGQTVIIRYPDVTHTVKAGDSLWSIAQMHRTTVAQLYRNNPNLQGRELIFPGQVLVVTYRDQPQDELTVNAYAYPSIDLQLLRSTLPYLSQLTPFTYRFTEDGRLIPPQGGDLTGAAHQSRVAPILHLSNLDEQAQFSPQLAHELLDEDETQTALIAAILVQTAQRGYLGVDVDFEFLYGEDADDYAEFLSRLRRALTSRGLPLMAALAPKASAEQAGRLYEGHDYRAIARAVDFALLMTYEWGHLSGPPMAVAPLPEVRRVVEYALTEFPPERLYLGIPNYGYNWTLPFVQGSRAVSLGNQEAVQLAWDRRAAIRYDDRAQAPWFRYVDDAGHEHEVWFEDCRSIQAKLKLAQEYKLHGVSYWNLDRPFPQNWTVLSSMTNIRPGV